MRSKLTNNVLLASCMILMLAHGAPALAAGSLADDYIRTDFTVENGLPDNVVNAIVQSANGLLWLGTESGLASFDGRDFTTIDLSTAGSPSPGAVHALLESAEGDLWVGTDAGLVLIPRVALDRFDPALITAYHPGSEFGNEVDVVTQTRDKTIWVGTSHGLFRRASGKFEQVIPATSVSRIAEASDNHLLLITKQGFIEWDGRALVPHPGLSAGLGVHDDQIFEVFQDRSGTVWYCTNNGVVRRNTPHSAPLQPANVRKTAAFHVYQDSQNTLWIASGIGIYRVHDDQMETPAPDLHPRSFYSGRDGELWIGTNGNGLVHLSRRTMRMFTAADGLPNDTAMAILPAHDGRVWVGTNCGLSVFDGKRFKPYSEKDGLLNSCVWALAQDAKDNLWIGTYGGGLFRLRDGRFAQYSIEQGLVSNIVLQIAVAGDQSLWIATPEGVSHMHDGKFRNYTTADGLSSNRVLSVHQDRGGTIWAATQAGVDRLVADRFLAFPPNQPRDGPFSFRFAEDSLGNLYTSASPKGISLITRDGLMPADEDLKLLDMVETPQHELWFSGTNGVIRVRRDDLINAARSHDGPLDYRFFDRSDGMNSIQCSVGAPDIALAADGKLWVATVKGVGVIDLAQLPQPRQKPKIFVGAITVGNHKELARQALILPPGTNHVEIQLEAIDLASPQKLRLQYRLDGVDAAWLDAGPARTAVYTNIPLGAHTFHVRASGSDGVWDRNGIVYNIAQAPYFYQTAWFRFVAVTALLLLLSAAYLVRVRQLVAQTRMRLEERLAERERIARELHDTLLQGVLSAAMQLDLAEDQLAPGSPTKPLLRRVLQMMRQVTEEGRDALRGLRTYEAHSGDLGIAFSRISQELAVEQKVQFRVLAQGATRRLCPPIRNEVYRIGREAIVNAFVHANAQSVEVSIEYANRYFRLLVRDDGCGIEANVLNAGREGHWGLVGMRERSEGMGGSLKLRSRNGAGTELELTIPAGIAFFPEPNGVIARWLHWLTREWLVTPPTRRKKRE